MEIRKLEIEMEMTEDEVDWISNVLASFTQRLVAEQGIPKEVALLIATEQVINVMKGFQEEEAASSGVRIVKKESETVQ